MVKYRDDNEYQNRTTTEMICPECGMYVLVFGTDQHAEFHEQRYFGRLRMCPGTDKMIKEGPKRTRTSLFLVKNPKGRYPNPTE